MRGCNSVGQSSIRLHRKDCRRLWAFQFLARRPDGAAARGWRNTTTLLVGLVGSLCRGCHLPCGGDPFDDAPKPGSQKAFTTLSILLA
jgi:hypothetical protein